MASIADVFLKAILDDSGIPQQAQASGQKAGQSFGAKFSGGLNSALHGAIAGIGIGAGISAFNSLSTAVEKSVDFLKDSVGAAEKLQSANVLLYASIRQNVQGWNGNTEAIDKATEAGEKLGFTNLEQRDSLRVLVAQTRNLNDALQAQRVAMDLARLRGIDLATASLLVGKAYDGNVGALKRFGIAIDTGTKGVAALQAIEKVAGGQAEAFSKTQAGAAQALAAEWEGFKEQIGNVVLPALTAATHFLTENVIPALKTTGDIVGDVAHVLGPVLGPILDHLPQAIEILAAAFATKLVIGAVNATKAFLGLGEAAASATAAIESEAVASGLTATANSANSASIDLTASATSTLSTAADAAVVKEAVLGKTTKDTAVALDKGAESAKGFAVSLKTIGFAALVAIPILGQIQEGIAGLSNQFFHGKEFGADYNKVLDAVGGSEGEAVIAFQALSDAAKKQNQPLTNVVRRFTDLVDAGVSVSDALTQVTTGQDLLNRGLADADTAMLNEANAAHQAATGGLSDLQQALQGLADGTLPKLKDALDKSGAELTQAGPFWAVKLKTGETVLAGSADDLAAKIPDAVKDASDRAAAIAAQTPGKIAAALLGAQDQLLTDANQVATAMNKALQLKVDIANTRKQLADQLAEIKKSGKAATAEQLIQLNTERLQLAAYLLEQDPKSKEAAALLKNALIGATPATKLAIQQMLLDVQTETQAQTPAIQKLMQDLGLSLPQAITQHTADTAAAATQQVTHARDALIAGKAGLQEGARQAGAAIKTGFTTGVGNPYGGGYSIGSGWLGGITQSIINGINSTTPGSFGWAVGKVKNLLGGSLPTEGPLQHPERGGLSVGQAWAGGIGKGIASVHLSDPLAALASTGFAPNLGAALPAAAGVPAPNVTYVIQAEGNREVVRTPQDAIALMQRLSLFTPAKALANR